MQPATADSSAGVGPAVPCGIVHQTSMATSVEKRVVRPCDPRLNAPEHRPTKSDAPLTRRQTERRLSVYPGANLPKRGRSASGGSREYER
jgi:hypothetical protein